MGNRGKGRWAVLLLASFAAHIALTVNSTATALWNEQGRQGSLLTQQLADAAAPLVLARDMVSLSVLTSHYENHPGIAGARLFNMRHELIAEAGEVSNKGRLFTAPLQVQQQPLGQIELRLSEDNSSDIIRLSMSNIMLSGLLHALIFLGGLFMGERKSATIQSTSTQTHAMPAQTPLPPTPAAAPVVNSTPPAATTSVTLLHIALDDPNGLLTRVNASMADELLSLFDQFIDRAARLYGGNVTSPFSPDGVLLRFDQGDALDREFQALAAAQLFLQLVEASQEERRQHGRLCLNCKVGALHNRDDANTAALLARTAPTQRVLSNLPETTLGNRCQLSASYHLALSIDETLHVGLLESFAPEYQQLINNQHQQILGPSEIIS
jgi:uncharacterized membrane protein affecting hemolysin expression